MKNDILREFVQKDNVWTASRVIIVLVKDSRGIAMDERNKTKRGMKYLVQPVKQSIQKVGLSKILLSTKIYI